MRMMRSLYYKFRGAYNKAPLAVVFFAVILCLGVIFLIIGMRAKPPVKKSPSTESTITMPVKETIEKTLKKPAYNFVDIGEDNAPTEAQEVAGKLLWLLNVPTKESEKILQEIQAIVSPALFFSIRQEYFPPEEEMNWTEIKVVTSKKYENEDDWWLLYVSGMAGEEQDAMVSIQIRKVDGTWLVTSLETPSTN
ncbi:hypothetical protein [Thermoactinomyces sp. DSM 45892]|uniref:hypothetical protein n=1 Tax=Thermoactinomyces sp. DSM 45892 TaxID=1882753 RepID=UPI000899644F|nr:hypothetical protein [Thermoactinomyces sp. DSM 45892]SDY87389.1 hypothetical protein SAMN05444416_109135 [Thermoactinomyces sp. DSM 45892]